MPGTLKTLSTCRVGCRGARRPCGAGLRRRACVVRAVRVTCCDRRVAAVVLDERDLAFQPAEPGADARDREPFRGPLSAGLRTIGCKRRECPLELFVQNPWRRRRVDLSRCLLQMLFEGALAGPASGQSGGSDDADDSSTVPASHLSDHSERRVRCQVAVVSCVVIALLKLSARARTRVVIDAGEGTRTLTPPKETPDFKSGAYDQFRHPGGAKDSPEPSLTLAWWRRGARTCYSPDGPQL
jgi:hypothetical protein